MYVANLTQNNRAELWSLLNCVLPDIIDDLATFEEWYVVKLTQVQFWRGRRGQRRGRLGHQLVCDLEYRYGAARRETAP